MIVDWLLSLMVGMVGWITDLMTWEGAQPRDVFADFEFMVRQFGSVGVWVDWASFSAAIAISIGVWLVCAGVKLVRAIAAHVPQFGGAG